MKIAKSFLCAAMVFGGSLAMVGCQSSHDSGVKSDYRSQWTMVAADTKATTDAAKSVLMADDLKDIKASSTEVDGMATGKKADGTKVAVMIKKSDSGSQVSVTVGMMGDPKLGADYAAKIKMRAEGK